MIQEGRTGRRVGEDVLGALEALLLVAREPAPLVMLAEAVGASEAETDTILRVIVANY